jgi:nucleoid DNA-binding protein
VAETIAHVGNRNGSNIETHPPPFPIERGPSPVGCVTDICRLTVKCERFSNAFQQNKTNFNQHFFQRMTKRELVVRISGETDLVQRQVLGIVQRTLDYISEAVAKGETVELRNFGVFEVKVRKARVGRNPNKPEKDVRIPPRAVVKFKAGKKLRDRVIKLTPTEKAKG